MTSDSPTPGSALPTAVVPMFPLAAVYLFPGTVLPLRVFEPRYVQLVEDLLDATGRFVLSTVVPGHEAEMPDAPPVHPVGGLGEIGRHERLPTGEFLIFVVGLARVHLEEVDSDRLYRRVRATPVVEDLPTESALAELKPRLVNALRPRLEKNIEGTRLQIRGASGELPLQDLPLGQLTDLLLLQMQLPPRRALELYSLADVEARARQTLEESRRQPPDGGGGRIGDFLAG